MSAVTVSPDIQDSPQIVRLIARAVEAGEIAMTEVRDAAEVAELEPEQLHRQLVDAGVEMLSDGRDRPASRNPPGAAAPPTSSGSTCVRSAGCRCSPPPTRSICPSGSKPV